VITNLHHVAILTADIEVAAGFYAQLFGIGKPEIIQVNKENMKFKSIMLPIGDQRTFLQIIQPIEGPLVKVFQERGEGAIAEIGYEVDDIEKSLAQLTEEGFKPLDFGENEIEGSYITSKYGNRYCFLSTTKMHGTRTELVQVMNKPQVK
jgi:catechol 2,3-dioxygenase-like lactoylglutathione lyase family enzyme